MQKRYCAIAFLILPFTIHAQILQRQYDVIKHNEVIGTLSATKKYLTEGYCITIESNTSITILIDFNITVYQFNKYKNGRLTDAMFIQNMNGRRKVHNTLQWGLDSYTVQKDGRKLSMENLISYSVASLYFDEPKSIQSVFSENQLAMLPIHKKSAECYEVKLPDGKSNFYSYRNGVLVHAKLSTRFTTVEVVLKEFK